MPRRQDSFCLAPGCGKALGKQNSCGVCNEHKHMPGVCRCVQCLGHAQRRKAPVVRADVRRVVMQSGERQVGVSLRREPWATGAAPGLVRGKA